MKKIHILGLLWLFAIIINIITNSLPPFSSFFLDSLAGFSIIGAIGLTIFMVYINWDKFD